MTDIHLVIADQSLRAAIAEQLNLAGLGDVKEGGDLGAALMTDTTAAVILDESSADKRNLKALRETGSEKKKRVFVLGAIEAEVLEGTGIETFTKPFRLGQLLARLQFRILSAPKLRGAPVVFGPYRFDPQTRCIQIEARADAVRLTEKEAALIEYLGNSAGAVGREELLAAVWGYDERIDTHTLETHIYQLRQKLDPTGGGTEILVNEEGAYRLKRE